MLTLQISLLCQQQPLLAPPSAWIHHLGMGLRQTGPRTRFVDRSPEAPTAYLNMLASVLSSAALVCDMSAVSYAQCLRRYRDGTIWPSMGITMAGVKRMQNIHYLLRRIAAAETKGSYVECGVWRGGMSIFAKAALEAYSMQRAVYLCDSFQGLPSPRQGSLRADEVSYTSKEWNATLAQRVEHVAGNFRAYGVPLTGVNFVPGYFVKSLPGLRTQLQARGERLSVLRLDGDIYDSTIDILYNLYDLVEVGGFVVIDDFGWTHGTTASSWPAKFGAKDAILDFRALHGIEDALHVFRDIDGNGAWFSKAREVSLRRDDYIRSIANGDYGRMRPQPKLNSADYARLMREYDKVALTRRERAGPIRARTVGKHHSMQ